MTRGAMVAQAMPSWEGTPFHPHARVKGAGVDCKGLLWGVASELGFPEAESEYARSTAYCLHKQKGIPADDLVGGFEALFDRVEEMETGDILLMLFDKKPGHIAIYDGNGKAWHAQIHPNTRVKKATLRSLFHYYPLHSIWRWRD